MPKRFDLIFLLLSVFMGIAFPLYAALAIDNNISLEKKDAEAYHAAGYEAQVQGNLPQAKFLYERARTFDPEDPAILNDLGLVYESLGEITAAEEQYLKAISIDFKCLPAYSNLGNLYKDQGKFDQAVHYLESRVKYGDPSDKWTLEAQAAIDAVMRASPTLRKKKIEADKKVLENAMVLRARERVRVSSHDKGVNADMEYQRGLLFFAAHQYDAAVKAFETCLKEDPAHKKAAHMIARAKAMPSTRIALKKAQISQEQAMYGKSQRFKDDPVNDFAVKELETAARQEVNRKAVRRVIERAHMASSTGAIAKRVPLKTDDPMDVAAIEYAKGMRLMQDGYRLEAVKAFDRALVFLPDDAEIQAARMKALGN